MSIFAVSGLMLANVKDYGAIGNGSTDDRVAIQAAIDDAITNDLGGIFFPQGFYAVSVTATSSLTVTTSDFHIKGQGDKSVIRFITEDHASTDRVLLGLTGSGSNILISSLVLDGNKANITNPSTRTRLLDISSNSDVRIDRVVMRNSTGSATRIGNTTTAAEYISFRSCTIHDCVNSGLIFDDASFVRVANCDFYGNTIGSGIDGGDIFMQPTGSLSVANYIIEGCFINHNEDDYAIFKGGTVSTSRITIANNTILGAIRLSNQTSAEISDNFVRVGEVIGEGDGSLVELNACSSILIKDNHFELNNNDQFMFIDGACNDVIIEGNFWNAIVLGPNGFEIREVNGISICDNVVIGGADGAGDCIQINAGAGGVSNVTIHDNQLFGNFSTSIEVTPTSGNVGRVSIQDNWIRNSVRFLSGVGSFTARPVVSGNYGLATSPFFTGDFANLPEPCVIVGGGGNVQTVGSSIGATFFAGDGSPEGAVTGNIGDTYTNLTASQSGTTLFVKETGAGTQTGWIALGQSGIKDMFFSSPNNSPMTTGDHIGNSVGINGTSNIEFRAPSDLNSVVALEVIIIPGATLGAADVDLDSDYGAPGENYAAHSESDTTITFAWTLNEITAIDVSSVFSALAANDVCGLLLTNNGVTGGYQVLGLRLQYR